MSQICYYYLPMLLVNIQIKLCNSLVMYVTAIQFSLFYVNFIVIFRTFVKISQIYWATLYNKGAK